MAPRASSEAVAAIATCSVCCANTARANREAGVLDQNGTACCLVAQRLDAGADPAAFVDPGDYAAPAAPAAPAAAPAAAAD